MSETKKEPHLDELDDAIGAAIEHLRFYGERMRHFSDGRAQSCRGCADFLEANRALLVAAPRMAEFLRVILAEFELDEDEAERIREILP